VAPQELSNILDFVTAARAGGDGDGDERAEAAEADESADQRGPQKQGLQTFVFSATLTLPDAQRRRLRKGASHH
jgi:hypothetical protein